MTEISITELSDDEIALLATHGAYEADRLEAQAEQLRRKTAEANEQHDEPGEGNPAQWK